MPLYSSCIFIFILFSYSLITLFSNLRSEDTQATVNTYKQLKIIITLYNQSMKILLPSVKFLVIVPTVFAAYAVVRLEGIVTLFCAVYALDTTVLLEIGLNFLAEQEVRSRNLLEGLKRAVVRRKSVLGKELAAARPAAITVGSGSYFVDKALVLTVLQIIATNAVNVLLMN